MKTLKTFLAIAIISILGSCSKSEDETTPIPTPVASNYRIISDIYNSYEYNTAGKLSKTTPKNSANGASSIYTYNSQGNLTRYSDGSSQYAYAFTDYAYDAIGKVINSFRTYKGTTADSVEFKQKFGYTYNSLNQITREDYYIFQGGAYVLSQYFTLNEYNSIGKISSRTVKTNTSGYSKDEYFYDANGNLNDVKRYDLKAGSATEYYLQTRYQYTYGTKKDPLYDLFPNRIFGSYPAFGFSPNNSLDEITSNYNETTLISNNTYTKPQYTYNDGGYPIKEVGATVDEFTYQKY